MCLGIPGKIVAIYEQDGVRMGNVDFGGVSKEVCLSFVPEVEVGDYTIVHVGFAITHLDEASAQESLALLRQIGALDEELLASQHEGATHHMLKEGTPDHALS